MKTFFLILQIIFAVVLIFLITIQAKGTGLSKSFMGGSSLYSTKRGFEKIVFYATIVTTVFFFLSSILQLVI